MADPQSTFPNRRYKHGQHRSREYSSWQSAKGRCYRESMPSYPHYGGCGITMCDRWRDSFAAFVADMGPRPDGATLDRIDPAGNYEPGNCRWASLSQQRRNQTVRGRKLAQRDAEQIRALAGTMTHRAIGKRFGISHTMARHIIEGRYWNDSA